MKRKILVTGGAGFIGSSIAEALLKETDNLVVVVDNLSTGSLEKLPVSQNANFRFIKGNVNDFKDISSIFYAYSFDFVFHYAAVVGVKRTLLNPVQVLNDITGIRNILSLSKNTSVKRVFFSSSSEVYGEPVEFPQNEYTTPLNSRLPYAIVKNVGEAYLRAFQQEYNLNYTIFRLFNTYGPKQTVDFVMSKFIAAALQNRDITIYGDGKQTRTFCYIDDNVEACLNAFYQNKFINDVVNIGNDNEITILDLAKIIIRETGSSSKIIHVPPLKDGDMRRRIPDITNMVKLLKRKPITLEEGIKKILQHHQFIFS